MNERLSVQDAPLVDEYIQINMKLIDGTNTLYIYPDGGKYYAERPYQGIYELICQPIASSSPTA